MASPGMAVWMSALGVGDGFIKVDDYTLTTVGGLISISFGNTGNLTLIAQFGGPANPKNWWSLQPISSIGDNYEVRLTVNSGTSPTGGPTVGVWHAITFAQTWTLTSGNTGNWTIEVREIADTSKIDSGVFIVTTI